MVKQVNPLKPRPHEDFFLEKLDSQQSKGAHQSAKLVNSLKKQYKNTCGHVLTADFEITPF